MKSEKEKEKRITHYDVTYLKVEGVGIEHWVTIGKAFPAQGRIKVRFDAQPVERFWNGELILFAKGEDDG